MANATLSGHVLRRSSNSFNGEDGRLVSYHEAVVIEENGGITVVRSVDRADLVPFEPGTAVDGVEVEIKRNGNVRATIVGLAKSAGTSPDW